MQDRTFLTYREVFEALSAMYAELAPTEAYKSHPLPTLRWRQPAWVAFAAPHLLRPGSLKVGRPDRWWSISAESRALLAYAQEGIIPLVTLVLPQEPGGLIALSAPDTSIEGVHRLQRLFAEGLDLVSGPFFQRQTMAKAVREAALSTLVALIAPEIMQCYQAATPDFFEWLET
jgi:hypothetical protein